MASRDIFAATDVALAAWLELLASKIDTHAKALAITSDDVDALKADALVVDWAVKAVPSLRASTQQFTAYKEDLLNGQTGGAPKDAPATPSIPKPPPPVPDGVVPRTRSLVQRIKKSPGYTEAIGRDLGLVAPAGAADTVSKPTFRGTALPHSEVRLDWTKGGHSGVIIQCMRNGDADWVNLGRDNYSPYVDGRAPITPGANETRKYRMRYLDKDDEVGEWSDVVSVVTTA